jgi:hypothetical protein
MNPPLAELTQEERARAHRLTGSHAFDPFVMDSFTASVWSSWFVKLIEFGVANSLSLPLTHVEQFAEFGWATLAGFLPIIGRSSRAATSGPTNNAHVQERPDHVTSH